uniref:Uncharacterized protein n=1 Tax=Sphaerodactylus townsendi TaxID=933632 RepID=A0ACB8FDV8_9SAUR
MMPFAKAGRAKWLRLAQAALLCSEKASESPGPSNPTPPLAGTEGAHLPPLRLQAQTLVGEQTPLCTPKIGFSGNGASEEAALAFYSRGTRGVKSSDGVAGCLTAARTDGKKETRDKT